MSSSGKYLFALFLVVSPGFQYVNSQTTTGFEIRDPGWIPDLFSKISGWWFSSCLFYGVPEWNKTVVGYDLVRDETHTGISVGRNGIPGWVTYSLTLAHTRRIGPVNGGVFLDLYLQTALNRTPRLRASCDLQLLAHTGSGIDITAVVYDWPGWIYGSYYYQTGTPFMRLGIIQSPGRQVKWMLYSDFSPDMTGPFGMEIFLQPDLAFESSFGVRIRPIGFSTGVSWDIRNWRVLIRLYYANALGVKPVILFSQQ